VATHFRRITTPAIVAEYSRLDRYSLGDDESVSRKRAKIRNPARVAETIMFYGFIMT
jgi:hypothetical protein